MPRDGDSRLKAAARRALAAAEMKALLTALELAVRAR
jgi:hypothetical protein